RLQLLLGTRQPADNRATGGRSEVAGANAGDGRGADRPCVVASRTIRLAGGAGAVESAAKAATPAARSGSSRSNDLGSLITVACGATRHVATGPSSPPPAPARRAPARSVPSLSQLHSLCLH